MRVKTEARRQAIMEAAAALFCERGFDRTSMAAVAARTGGSKMTLYNYFGSKEELFAAVMVEAMEEQADAMFALLDRAAGALRPLLEAFGSAYLDLTLSPVALGYIRVGVAEGGGSLGPLLYRSGPESGWRRVAAHIERWMADGLLRSADPWVAALHLKGLLEAGMLEPRMFGADSVFKRDAAVADAVAVFLRAYTHDSD